MAGGERKPREGRGRGDRSRNPFGRQAGRLWQDRCSVSPPEVRVHTRAGGLTIDIRAADRVGLLHDLAAAMAALGLEVDLAKIDTRGGEALDIFEVRNPDGRSEEEVRAALAGRSWVPGRPKKTLVLARTIRTLVRGFSRQNGEAEERVARTARSGSRRRR